MEGYAAPGMLLASGTSGQPWMTPEPLSFTASEELEALYHSPSLSVQREGLQRQESHELLQSLLPELFSWVDSLSAQPASEHLSSPASILSENSSWLPHTTGDHIGEIPGPATRSPDGPQMRFPWS